MAEKDPSLEEQELSRSNRRERNVSLSGLAFRIAAVASIGAVALFGVNYFSNYRQNQEEELRISEQELIRLEGEGSLYVISKPGPTEIFLGDTVAGRTTLNMDIQAGEHIVTVRREGYEPYIERVLVDSNESVWKEVNLNHKTARLKIGSNPSGATVFINGERKGTTTFENPRINTGEYDIRLVLPEHVTQETTLVVEKPFTPLLMKMESGAVRFEGRWISEDSRDEILQDRRKEAISRARIAEENQRRLVEEQRQQDISSVLENLEDRLRISGSWADLSYQNLRSVGEEYQRLVELGSSSASRIKRDIVGSFRSSLEEIASSSIEDYRVMIELNDRLARVFPEDAGINHGLIGGVIEQKIRSGIEESLSRKESKIRDLRNLSVAIGEELDEWAHRQFDYDNLLRYNSDFYNSNNDFNNLQRFSPEKVQGLRSLFERSKEEYDSAIVGSMYDVVVEHINSNFGKIFVFDTENWWLDYLRSNEWNQDSVRQGRLETDVEPALDDVSFLFACLYYLRQNYPDNLHDKDFDELGKIREVKSYLNGLRNTIPGGSVFDANDNMSPTGFLTGAIIVGTAATGGLAAIAGAPHIVGSIKENKERKEILDASPLHDYFVNNNIESEFGDDYRAWLSAIDPMRDLDYAFNNLPGYWSVLERDFSALEIR
jgi:hypothetical protein